MRKFWHQNFLPWKDHHQKKTLQVGTSIVILADQASGVKRDISKVHHHHHFNSQKGDDELDCSQATTLTLAASPIPPRDHEDLGNSLALEQPANGAHSVTQV